MGSSKLCHLCQTTILNSAKYCFIWLAGSYLRIIFSSQARKQAISVIISLAFLVIPFMTTWVS
jgi:hypothetical protein